MYVAGEWRGAAREEEVRSPYDGEVVGHRPGRERGRRSQRALAAAVEGARAMRALSAVGAQRDPAAAPPTRSTSSCRRARAHDRARGRQAARSRREARRRGSPTCSGAERRRGRAHARRDRARRRGARTARASSRSRSGSRAGSSSRSRRSTTRRCSSTHKVGPALAAGQRGRAQARAPDAADRALPHADAARGRAAGERDPVPDRARAPSSATSSAPTRASARSASRARPRSGSRSRASPGVKRLSLELGCELPADRAPGCRSRAGRGRDRSPAATSTPARSASRSSACSWRDEVYGDFVERADAARRGAPHRPPARRAARRSGRSSRRPRRCASSGRSSDAVDGGATLRHRRRARGRRRRADASSATSTRRMEISRAELFGPAVALTPVSGIDEAIALANDSDYGLGAGLFTSEHRQRAPLRPRGRLPARSRSTRRRSGAPT